MKARVEKTKCFHCERDYPTHAIDYHQEQCGITRKFPCDLCGRHFPSPKGMKVHQGLTHSADERDAPFKCDVPGCEYGGASAQVLYQHRRRHNKGMPARARSRSRSRSRLPSRSPAHQQNLDFLGPADQQPPIRNNPPIIVQISRSRDGQSGSGYPQKYLSNLRQPHHPNKSQMQAEGRQTSPSGPNDHDYCSSSFDEGQSSRATSRGRNLSGASRDGRNESSFGVEMEAGDGNSPPPQLDRENRNENEEMDEVENEPPMDSDNEHEQEEEHSPNDNFHGVDGMEEEDEGQNDEQGKEKKKEEPKKQKIDWVSMIPERPLPEVAQQIVEIGLRQKISCYGKLDTEDRAKLLHLNPERAMNIMQQLDLYWDNIVKKIEDSYEAVQAIIEEYGIRPNSRIADMIKEYVQQHATKKYLFVEEEEEDLNGPSTSAASANRNRNGNGGGGGKGLKR